jgi:putative CocE/NonD family hydrolase
MRKPALRVSLVFVLLFAMGVAMAQAPSATPPAFNVRAYYTKYEHYITARDGKRLFTSIYVPKDTSRQYPFLMTRTPYSVGPYGADQYKTRLGPSEAFDRAGYIFVFQDVRGRYLSEGTFVEMRPHIDHPAGNNDVDESTDTYDTVEWLLKNIPNNNGKVGIWGISYPGFFTSASIIDSHPAIKAASPEAPMTDLFFTDDAYHGGAFMLAANFGFYSSFKPRTEPAPPPKEVHRFDYGTNDGYEFFLHMGSLANADKLYFHGESFLWNDQVAHNSYDSYWQARDLSRHMHGIKCAVLTVGGWFDAEDLSGPFKTYHAIEKNNPGIFNALVVGPWVHGGWARWQGERLGRVSFSSNTGDYYRERIIFPFFEQFLKGTADAKLPKAYMFETGTNVWRQYSQWPPANAQQRALFFHANGKLSFEPPTEAQAAFDEYVSDPAKPVPFVGYAALAVPQEYMLSDQRFASKRPDVLVYQTDPLDEDVTIVGPVSPRLHVSTSGTDSDWVVKLIDVYPADYPDPEADPNAPQPRDVALPAEKLGGYQQLVRGEPMRGKFRNNWEHPEAFVPGKSAAVNFEMPDINHTFRRGHRIMVQVQSSWFPLMDLNPQTFLNIPDAKASDFHKATQRVYRSQGEASQVVVQVLGATTTAHE